MTETISILGAGAWGTALAQVFAAAGRKVLLYARDPNLARDINHHRVNALYLPKQTLHTDLVATHSLEDAVSAAAMIVLVTPTQYVRALLSPVQGRIKPDVPIINAAKGIEIATGKLLSELVFEFFPKSPYAILSGPTFAHEVAAGFPTAVTFASHAEKGKDWAKTLSSKTFRPYWTKDVVGAEVGGALKNVIAIACGIVDGRGLGQNAKAAVMTRGMAEIRRYGIHKGAEVETFLGLSGIGDLTLTCHSSSSRNYALGVALGRGGHLEDILSARRAVVEGIATAEAISKHSHTTGLRMPIIEAVNQILHHKADIDAVVEGLLSRDLKNEAA